MNFKRILKSGYCIEVSEQDIHLLDKYILSTMKPALAHTRYVVLKDKKTRKYAGLLHRIILNVSDNVIVDHVNGNGLDCSRNNIRIATFSQNQFNRRPSVNKVKGVFFRKDRGYWQAKITVNKKIITLGSFHIEDQAIEARLLAEEKYFGSFNGLGTFENAAQST